MFKRLTNIGANYIMIAALILMAVLVLVSDLNMSAKSKASADSKAFKPMRIVSMSVSADEMLLALVGNKRLIAVSPWSDVPSVSCISNEVKAIPYRAHGSNAEALLAMKADLIVVPDYSRAEAVRTLRDSGAKVFVCPTPHNIKEVQQTLRQLGKLVGEEAKAEEIITDMNDKLQRISKQIASIPQEKRVRVVRMQEKGAYYAPKTSFMEVCRLAGLQDATEELKYDYSCTLSQEEIVLLNPDVFVLENWNYDGKHDAEELKKQVLSNEAYKATKAWQKQRAVLLPANHLLTVSQYMVDAVEDMAVAIYPEYVHR